MLDRQLRIFARGFKTNNQNDIISYIAYLSVGNKVYCYRQDKINGVASMFGILELVLSEIKIKDSQLECVIHGIELDSKELELHYKRVYCIDGLDTYKWNIYKWK